MQLSVATANFYYLPFAQTLDIIAESGFQFIELDLYWKGGDWEMAQHLKDLKVNEVIPLISRSGLTVSSIHDLGGMLTDARSTRGFINPRLASYLDALGYAPECIVLHTPHIAGDYDQRWWQAISTGVAQAAGAYRKPATTVTVENLPFCAGYYIPLATPQQLLDYTDTHDLGVTLDTTHYAQLGIDVVQAARVLKDRIRTVHLQ